MGSPEGSQRISVIHSRPPVICNSKLDDEPSDVFDNPHRDEGYNSSRHESEDNCGSDFPNRYDYQDIRRPEGEIPNSTKSHFPPYYPQAIHSHLDSSPSTSQEWNNPLHHSYLTAMAQERNQNMSYLKERPRQLPYSCINNASPPHHHQNIMPSHKISFNTHPYKSTHRGPSENYGSGLDISPKNENLPSPTDERYRKLSGCSDYSNSTTCESSFTMPESPRVIKLECPPDLKEKIGNKPVSNCHVCGDLAIAHMHYGGVCCYSCKAFFRRATQTGKDAKYKCKNDKECTITYTNRRACQYCRWDVYFYII